MILHCLYSRKQFTLINSSAGAHKRTHAKCLISLHHADWVVQVHYPISLRDNKSLA